MYANTSRLVLESTQPDLLAAVCQGLTRKLESLVSHYLTCGDEAKLGSLAWLARQEASFPQ